jgi:hypothetical protein
MATLSTHPPPIRWSGTLTGLPRKFSRATPRSNTPRYCRVLPNNGLHPTPHHEASHVRCIGVRVLPGVMPLPLMKDMAKVWDEIISFYRELESKEFWGFGSMAALVTLIIENRDVSEIYPVTSHETLCLSKYQTYDEWVSKPSVSIRPASADHYWFSLTEPLEDGGIYRERVESILCPMDYALKAYDEMMGNLARLESAKSREA